MRSPGTRSTQPDGSRLRTYLGEPLAGIAAVVDRLGNIRSIALMSTFFGSHPTCSGDRHQTTGKAALPAVYSIRVLPGYGLLGIFFDARSR